MTNEEILHELTFIGNQTLASPENIEIGSEQYNGILKAMQLAREDERKQARPSGEVKSGFCPECGCKEVVNVNASEEREKWIAERRRMASESVEIQLELRHKICQLEAELAEVKQANGNLRENIVAHQLKYGEAIVELNELKAKLSNK